MAAFWLQANPILVGAAPSCHSVTRRQLPYQPPPQSAPAGRPEKRERERERRGKWEIRER